MATKKANEIEKVVTSSKTFLSYERDSENLCIDEKWLRRRLRKLVREAWHDGYVLGFDGVGGAMTKEQTVKKYGFDPVG